MKQSQLDILTEKLVNHGLPICIAELLVLILWLFAIIVCGTFAIYFAFKCVIAAFNMRIFVFLFSALGFSLFSIVFLFTCTMIMEDL